MPKIKKEKIKKVKAETPRELTAKEKLVESLLSKIPNCFDRAPRDSMSRSAVEKLADEILNQQ